MPQKRMFCYTSTNTNILMFSNNWWEYLLGNHYGWCWNIFDSLKHFTRITVIFSRDDDWLVVVAEAGWDVGVFFVEVSEYLFNHRTNFIVKFFCQDFAHPSDIVYWNLIGVLVLHKIKLHIVSILFVWKVHIG